MSNQHISITKQLIPALNIKEHWHKAVIESREKHISLVEALANIIRENNKKYPEKIQNKKSTSTTGSRKGD